MQVRRRRHRSTDALCVLMLVPALSRGSDIVLVDNTEARAAIFAPGENEWAGRRLADRLLRLTGARVTVYTAVSKTATRGTLVAVGTPTSNAVVREVLRSDARVAVLGEEGYLLKSASLHGRTVVVVAGGTLSGVNNAVSELVSWKLKLRAGGSSLSADLNETDRPALKYRILWTWDGQCNWAATVPEMMELYVRGDPNVGSSVVPYTPAGFRTHFTRAIDYLSDHKLNGLIVWGFLRDEHGGVEMGREISSYAKRGNVRLLPGVCSEASYGGFIFSTRSKYNLDAWGKQHPELQARNSRGEVVPGTLCPSKPENQRWLREGAEWLFASLPDIGGINLENGGFMTCHCADCEAERTKPGNDPNYFWDMTTTQKPILEMAKRMRPDGWMTFASYVGFMERGVREMGQRVVYPPRFLTQVPSNGICQWTLTKMVKSETWPDGTRPPKANFRAHIGLLHQGSIWGLPVDPGRWWASPGAWADDYSTLMPFVCSRAARAGMSGIVLTGQTGVQSPAQELNYLALEYFGWHPERSYDQFKKDRLASCYGGVQHAELFLKLLHNTTREPTDIEKDRLRAIETGRAEGLDVRQRGRWRNLADELARRLKAVRG